MCVALTLAERTISCVYMQSGRFGPGVPIYPDPIFILDDAEGADLVRTLDKANAILSRAMASSPSARRSTRHA